MNGQTTAQLTTQETGSLGQAGKRVLNGLLVVFQRRKENLGMRIVRRHLHFSDRDHPHTRVLQLECDDFRQIALNLIGDAQTAPWNGFAVFCHAEKLTSADSPCAAISRDTCTASDLAGIELHLLNFVKPE